jgi:hypothetical protein
LLLFELKWMEKPFRSNSTSRYVAVFPVFSPYIYPNIFYPFTPNYKTSYYVRPLTRYFSRFCE